MVLSRFSSPNRNRNSAESRYPRQRRTETHAAARPIRRVGTCGTVIRKANSDMLPSARRTARGFSRSAGVRPSPAAAERGAGAAGW